MTGPTEDLWLQPIATGLAAAADRSEASREFVQHLATGDEDLHEVADLVEDTVLAQRYRIDRARLNRITVAKLRRRRQAGLAVPVHAAGLTPLSTPPRSLVAGPSADRDILDRLVADYAGRATYTEPDPAQKAPLTAGAVLRGEVVASDRVLMIGWGVAAVLATVALLCLSTIGVDAAAGPLAVVIAVSGVLWSFDKRRLRLSTVDWLAVAEATVSEPSPAPGTVEYRLAALAELLSTAISGCPVWKSEFLADHRRQLDPRREAETVAVHAARISDLRARIEAGPIVGEGPAAKEARYQRAADRGVLDSVVDTLSERVATLLRYAAEIQQLDEEYLALQAITRTVSVRPDLDELVRHTGADLIAADRLARLTADAHAARAAIEAHMRVLSADLTLLTN
ncbi:MAG: hypothetical protein INR66_00340 [Gordonia polyisoprenivorans]|nr:hypothetical protein [Gordonia polyisoprenivorans]